MRFLQFQFLGFPLFGFQHGFGNGFAIRCRLAADGQRGNGFHAPNTRCRQLATSRPRLLFKFFKARVVSRFFTVGREFGFFFLDLLLFHVAGRKIVRKITRDIACDLESCPLVCFARELARLDHRRGIARCRCSRIVPGFRF